MPVKPFSDEQSRAIVNMESAYEALLDARRERSRLPYGMAWKSSNGADYLARLIDRAGNATGLGRRSPETEAIYSDFQAQVSALSDRIKGATSALAEACAVCHALRTPMLPAEAAKALREIDRAGLLGDGVMVIGTNALLAYAPEASGFLSDAPGETKDFDLTWVGASPEEQPLSTLWKALKAADSTYTVNSEREFQARNAAAYEIELLAAPSRMSSFPRRDFPRPLETPSQEWLLLGRPVAHVVLARDRTAARIVAPDPRFFALHKLWLAERPDRNPLKRDKDTRQGMALMSAIIERMPQFPLNQKFEAILPGELRPYYQSEMDRIRPRA